MSSSIRRYLGWGKLVSVGMALKVKISGCDTDLDEQRMGNMLASFLYVTTILSVTYPAEDVGKLSDQ